MQSRLTEVRCLIDSPPVAVSPSHFLFFAQTLEKIFPWCSVESPGAEMSKLVQRREGEKERESERAVWWVLE